MNHLLDQLYKTKLRLAGLVVAVAGTGLLFLSHSVATTPTLSWLIGWPTSELGTTLLSAGVVAVIFEYYARKEADERATEHFRRAIRQEAPAIRDAVLDSFAFSPEGLKSIASDDTLDRIATNAIGLRVGDPELARDAYADLREQVIRSPERWRDVDVSVTLSPWTGGPATGHGSMFVATIHWEYRARPARSTMRFACVSEQAEHRDLLRDPTIAGQWYFGKTSPVAPSSAEAFELVQFSVNGKERDVRRTERPGSQIYTVALGKASANGDDVTISYTYRVLLQRHGHLLFLDFPRPAKGVHIQLDYSQVDIRQVNVVDYFASPYASQVEWSPETAPTKTINVSFNGQIFPRAGVVLAWVLADEMPAPTSATNKNLQM